MSMNIAERQPLLRRTFSRPHSRHSLSPLNVIPTASNSNVDRRSLCRIRTASITILLCVVFERVAFYALTGNLVLFLNIYPLQWASYHAIDASLYFTGISFATSLIGGWLADSFLGRFKAILVSFIVYIIGYCVMPLISPQDWSLNMTKSTSLIPLESPGCNLKNVTVTRSVNHGPFEENCAWLIFVILSIIGIGTGCVKANIAPFGSDQVAGEGQQATLSFFNWFYWSINLGAFIGLSVIAYVEQEVSFFYGYISAVSCLALAILIFIAGRFFFLCRPPEGSVLSNIFRIIHEAWKKKRQRSRTKNVPTNDRDRVVDEAEPANRNLSFLDYAKHRHGGIFHDVLVDSVKQLKKIIIVFIALIPYWVVYFQMQTSFMIQGLHMRLMINLPENYTVKTLNCTSTPEITLNPPSHQMVAAAWFSLSDVFMLIILLPLFDRIIYPKLEKRYGPVSMSCRILVGMFFSIAAMIVAGVVEHFRLQQYWPNHSQPCLSYSISQQIGKTVYYAADLSIFWQIPQYALIGVSEVFTSVAGLQFAVSMAPRSMKGIIMGLFYLFSGIGSLLGTAIISALSATETWFYPDDYGNINCRRCSQPVNGICDGDLQQCHLDYYFYLLAAIELVGVVLFIVVARSLHLDHLHHHAVTAKKLGNASDSFLDPPSGTSSDRDFVHSIQRQPSEES